MGGCDDGLFELFDNWHSCILASSNFEQVHVAN